jgi:serine/threonine-protein kinase
MIGQKLGSFRIEAELGSGAMGVVYRGINEVKNRPAAIKVIAAEQMGKGKTFERFIREAEILEQFRHPNIVRYMARGKSGGTYYYAMEYVTGPTLEKVLRDQGPLPWREVVKLAIQLCDALHYSHERGVVHRDLKPSNLMIADTGLLKLTDFGIAKDLDAETLTATGRTLGTAAYMAPEQIRGTPEISHKTDLYALGAVLYQMLTGQIPFAGTTAVVLMHAHINSPPPRASDKVEEIPKALDDLIVKLMAKDPSDRPWDAAAVAQTFRELQEKDERKEPIAMVWPQAGSPASMPTRAGMLEDEPPRKTKKKGKKGKSPINLEVAGLVGGLVVVGGLIAYLVWPPSPTYYYRQAKHLVTSPDPLDWIRARDEYLDPLDTHHPRHPFKEETEAWRDKIDLRDAERRAENLERPNLAAVTTFEEVRAALKIHHELDALNLWRELEKQLTREGRDDRGWKLLAHSRGDELEKAIARRRETVQKLLDRAEVPPGLSGNETAMKKRVETLRDIVARFGDYNDVADLVDRAKAGLPEESPAPGDAAPKKNEEDGAKPPKS